MILRFVRCVVVVLFVSLRLSALARNPIAIDELAEFGEFVGGKLAGFYEMDGQAAGGAVEDAVDEFSDHRAGGRVLCDGGGPLVAATGRFALHQAFIDHHAEYRGDGGGSDFATLAE